MALTLSVALAIPATPAEAACNHPFPKSWYVALAQCETQNNTRHKTRSYVGAFGFSRRTWDLFADTPNSQAHTLTFAQQARVLDRAFWFGHIESGRKQWAVGPWGHGCYKGSQSAQEAVCASQNRWVRKWARRCK